jgi:CMP-N,N'-diacetyllegionaminic acid synthase
MNVLGIIPARGGSKGVPNKNIKLLCGKPLIAYTIEVAKSSKLNKIIVSTDSELIAEIAKSFGADIPFIRPDELSSDTAKSLDVAIHALKEAEKIYKENFDAIMLLQPTTPFRTTEEINQAIMLLESNLDADSVISVEDVEGTHPARMKYLREGVLVDPDFCEAYENQNRQELEKMYIRNGAIYLTRKHVFMTNSYKGKKCLGLVMPSNRSINIDTLADFEYAEWVFEKYIKK